MTAQHQIQSLLLKIDQVLSKSSPRLPWIMSGDAAQQQQVLEQARDYLISLQQQVASGEPISESGGTLATQGQTGAGSSPGESAQQALKAVVQEMSYLRSNMMQPLRDDVTQLHQQRAALVAEIKELEARRGQLLPQQNQQQMLNEFLSTLMGRLQDDLTGRVVQTLADLEARSLSERSLPGDDRAANLPRLSSSERLEHIQMLQAKSDDLMLKLDSTLGVVFESLQKNIESYQESLGQGLEKMHGLGQQGEVLFATLLNRLAHQLGQEASSYLRASLESSERSLPGFSDVNDPQLSMAGRDKSPSWRTPSAAEPDQVSDDQIDQILHDLNSAANDRNATLIIVEGDRPPEQPLTIVPSLAVSQLDDIDLALETLDLNSNLALPDLTSDDLRADDADAAAIFQFDDEVSTSAVDDAILLQDIPARVEPATGTASAHDIDALDLLNQLTAEIEEALPDSQDVRQDREPGSDLTLMQSMPDKPSAPPSPENLYSEIDELYEDMFGAGFESAIATGVDRSEIQLSATAEGLATDAPPDSLDSSAEDVSVDALTDDDLFGIIRPDELVLDVSDDDVPGDALFNGLDHPERAEVASVNSSGFTESSDGNPFAEHTLETLLFDEPRPEAEPDTNLFQEELIQDEPTPGKDSSHLAESSPSVETISLLSDLVFDPSSDSRSEEHVDDMPAANTAFLQDLAAPKDDKFTSASPHESLLVADDAADTDAIELDFDDTTLQQLTSDLSELEGLEFDDAVAAPPPANPLVEAASVDRDEQTSALPLEDTNDLFENFASPTEGLSQDDVLSPGRSPDDFSPDESLADGTPRPDALPPAPDEVLAALTRLGMPAVTDDFLPPDDDFFRQDAAPNVDDTFDLKAPESTILGEFGETVDGTASSTSSPDDAGGEFASDSQNYLEEEIDAAPDQEHLMVSAPDHASDLTADDEEQLMEHPTVEELFATQNVDDPVLDQPLVSTSNQPFSLTSEPVRVQSMTEDDWLASIDEEMSLDDFFANANAEALDEAEHVPPMILDDFSASISESKSSELESDSSAFPVRSGHSLEPSSPDPEETPSPASPSPDPVGISADADLSDDETLSFPSIEGLDSLFDDLTRADEPPPDQNLNGGQTLFDLMTRPQSPDATFNGLSSYIDLSTANPVEPSDRESEVENGEHPRDEKKKGIVDETTDAKQLVEDSLIEPPQTTPADELNAQNQIEGDRPHNSFLELAAPASSATPHAGVDEAIDREAIGAWPDLTHQTADPYPPAPESTAAASDSIWFLGIDIGTTGISAVLLNRHTCELHPMYWVDAPTSPDQLVGSADQRFRLASTVVLSGSPDAPTAQSLGIPSGEVGREMHASSTSAFYHPRLLLHRLKPFLKIGIPHYSPQTSSWEPILQWSDHEQIALSHIHQALQLLLTTFSSSRSPLMAATSTLSCGAVGLDNAALQGALTDLAAVVIGQPSGWSDTYRFNVREAVLGARLVARPGQVMFINDAIATILSGLRSAEGRPVTLPSRLPQQPHGHNTDWQGYTLAINAGATTTEFALVNLPDPLTSLTYRDFALHSIPLAGDALDQDIICQLLYPSAHRSPRHDSADQLRGDRPSDRLRWDDFYLDGLPLPRAGDPDLISRERLRQHLESSDWGHHLLDAALVLKLVLQRQSSFAFELGDQHWGILQQDLGSRVFVPYVQRLHRELMTVLDRAGVSISEIQHVVCSGGSASLRIIAMWLRQKLPQATITQDTYATQPAATHTDSTAPTCSRVAYGLASLALHPTVMDLPRQRYGDYFLLLELLRTLPNQPLTLSNIMQMLESRGIDPQLCYAQVLTLLEGRLPVGLIPDEMAMHMLTPASQQNPDYRILQAAPLFDQRDHQTFQPNVEQCHQVRRYLNMLTASTRQKLLEPAIAELTF